MYGGVSVYKHIDKTRIIREQSLLDREASVL